VVILLAGVMTGWVVIPTVNLRLAAALWAADILLGLTLLPVRLGASFVTHHAGGGRQIRGGNAGQPGSNVLELALRLRLGDLDSEV
jgi:hypothetical protein